MAGPALLEVGRIIKPHGLQGEVVVALVTNRNERVAPGSVLHGPHGNLVVEHSRRFEATGDGRWIVAFAGVTSREGADALREMVLHAEPLEDPDALWAHELIGAEVVAVTGEVLGRVSAIEANPASDLLVLEGGGLIPLRFVVAREARSKLDRATAGESPSEDGESTPGAGSAVGSGAGPDARTAVGAAAGSASRRITVDIPPGLLDL